MKKALLPLLLVIPLVGCQSKEAVVAVVAYNLKASLTGHFTEVQANYLKSEDYTDTTPYNGNLSVSKPNPVSLTWESNGETSFSVDLYEDEALTKHIVSYTTNENSFDFYNPIFNQEYYVKVSTKDKDEVYNSNIVNFKEVPTISGPRNIYVDGVENFRDIGGYGTITNGAYKTFIKQGMLYRSGRFNDDKEEVVKPSITEAGIYEVNNHLKIKTEIDLRRTSNNEVGGLTNKSVLGDNVNYIQLPMAYGGNNILTFTGKLSGDDYEYDNPAMIKRFFEILADKNNYPIDFHCSIGKDRTGCLAYLVETLLRYGEFAFRDYMFTNFANAGMCKFTDLTERYAGTIMAYDTFDDNKTYAYLNEVVGISKDTLNSVIGILTA